MLFALSSMGQRTFDYGVSFGGNVVTQAVSGESIGTMPGGYGGIFCNWGTPLSHWDLQLALNFQNGLFQFSDPNLRGSLQMVNFRTLTEFHTPHISPFSIYGGIEVGKHLLVQRDLNLQNTGNSKTTLSSWRKVHLGWTTGINMALNNSTSFRVDHTFYPQIAFQSDRLYLPSYFSFGIQISFNQILINDQAKKQMVYNLRALNDPASSTDEIHNDTLYVLNYACWDSMTDPMLDSLFSRHYTFSRYRIIQREEIQEVKARLKPRFFAIVGDLYGSMNSPEGAGIFLLNKDFELTEFPYPVQTDYFTTDLSGQCFDDLQHSALVIRHFDSRLHARSRK